MCFNSVESRGERKDDFTTQSILLAIPNKEDEMNYKFKWFAGQANTLLPLSIVICPSEEWLNLPTA